MLEYRVQCVEPYDVRYPWPEVQVWLCDSAGRCLDTVWQRCVFDPWWLERWLGITWEDKIRRATRVAERIAARLNARYRVMAGAVQSVNSELERIDDLRYAGVCEHNNR